MISENRCKTPVLLVLQQLQFKVDHSISCHQLLFSNPSRDYVISYDKRNRTAHWVFEHLTKASVARNEEVDRQKSSFIEDEAIHPFFRSTNADYKVLELDVPIPINIGIIFYVKMQHTVH